MSRVVFTTTGHTVTYLSWKQKQHEINTEHGVLMHTKWVIFILCMSVFMVQYRSSKTLCDHDMSVIKVATQLAQSLCDASFDDPRWPPLTTETPTGASRHLIFSVIIANKSNYDPQKAQASPQAYLFGELSRAIVRNRLKPEGSLSSQIKTSSASKTLITLNLRALMLQYGPQGLHQNSNFINLIIILFCLFTPKFQ